MFFVWKLLKMENYLPQVQQIKLLSFGHLNLNLLENTSTHPIFPKHFNNYIHSFIFSLVTMMLYSVWLSTRLHTT